MSNLKVASCCEGEGDAGPLLGTPALTEEGVPDQDSFLQPRVQVQCDVAAVRIPQIHTEPGQGSAVSEAPPTPARHVGGGRYLSAL